METEPDQLPTDLDRVETLQIAASQQDPRHIPAKYPDLRKVSPKQAQISRISFPFYQLNTELSLITEPVLKRSRQPYRRPKPHLLPLSGLRDDIQSVHYINLGLDSRSVDTLECEEKTSGPVRSVSIERLIKQRNKPANFLAESLNKSLTVDRLTTVVKPLKTKRQSVIKPTLSLPKIANSDSLTEPDEALPEFRALRGRQFTIDDRIQAQERSKYEVKTKRLTHRSVLKRDSSLLSRHASQT